MKNFTLFSILTILLLFSSPLSAANFTSAGTGNWNAAATWTITSGTDADGIPDADDNVTIIGTITLNVAGVTINDLTCSSGSLQGANSLTIAGNLSVSGGTFAPEGAATVSGTLTWTGGSIGSSTAPTVTDVTIAGTTTFSTNTHILIKKKLILNNNSTWTAGDIYFTSGSILEIPASQTLTVNNASPLNFANNGGIIAVDMKGTLNKQGTSSLSISIPFNNTGTVLVNVGALSINSPYTGNGSIAVASGATLTVSSLGLNYLNPIFVNNGTVNGSSLNFNAAIPQLLSGNGTAINLLNVNNANDLTIVGTQTVSTTLTLTNGKILLQNGDLTVNGTISNANSSRFIVTQGTGRLIQSVPTASAKIFPIGSDANSYNPVSLQQTGSAAPFGAKVKVGLDNPLNKIGFVNRQWTVDNISGTPNAALGLSWLSPTHETGTFSTSDNRLYRWNGTAWVSASTSGAATLASGIHTRTQSGLSQFGPFAVSSCIPPAPSVSNVVYCQNAVATALTATGTSLLWYTAATGGTGSATAPTPSTTTAGTVSYFVTQTEDCESARAEIQVLVKPLPLVPSVSNIAYCQNATATALTATGSNLLWYNILTGGTGSVTAPTPSTITVGTTSYFVSQTVNGCEGLRAEIQVLTNPLPTTPSVSATQPACSTPTGSITIAAQANVEYSFDGGTSYQASNILSPATQGSYAIKVRNLTSGCASNAVSVTVNAPVGVPSTPSVSATQPACATPTGSITIAAQANVEYSFDGGTSYQASNILSPLRKVHTQ